MEIKNMNQNEIFEAGRKIGHLEDFISDALTKSQWHQISANNIIEDDGFVAYYSQRGSYYSTPKKFLQETKKYLDSISVFYKDYTEIKKRFSTLDYFKGDCMERLRLEMNYLFSKTILDKVVEELQRAIK